MIKSYSLPIPHDVIFHQGLEVWQIPGRSDGPTVLFCHGNAGNLRFPIARRNRFLALQQAGANLWVFDYRGYGYSSGSPSEQGVYQDAVRVHSLVRERHPKAKPFILYGRSLGGAVATYLATEVQQPDSLILESTFTSVPDVCAKWTHPKLASLMTYQFNSLQRIGQLDCPLSMIHGTADKVVPYELGRKLFEACPRSHQFLTVKNAGHNDLQRVSEGLYEETLARWLQVE